MRKFIVIGLAIIFCAVCVSAWQYPSSFSKPGGLTLQAEACGGCHLESGAEGAPMIDAERMNGSVHKDLSCTECHEGMSNVHGPQVPNVDCSRCHEASAQGFELGIHWQEGRRRNTNVPVCATCHGDHYIKPADSFDSTTSRRSVALTCGNCHTTEKEQFLQSAHGQALETPGKAELAPTCTTCHGEHEILQPEDEHSRVSRGQLPKTCGGCHDSPELAASMGIPSDRLKTYEDSEHGLRHRFGETAVATCEDCHGSHLVLPQSDPRSTVNVANIISTCGKCHPNANENFAAAPVHLEATLESSPGVFAVRWFYILFIAVLGIGFLVHIAFDMFALRKRHKEKINE